MPELVSRARVGLFPRSLEGCGDRLLDTYRVPEWLPCRCMEAAVPLQRSAAEGRDLSQAQRIPAVQYFIMIPRRDNGLLGASLISGRWRRSFRAPQGLAKEGSAAVSVEVTGSMSRRQLGRYLRELRNQQRLTVRAAAGRLEWSEAKMWRIETGQTSLRSLDVEAMCKIYGAPANLTEALMGLAKETKARGWWHAYGDVIPEGFDVYIGLEEAASQLAWYESELVPGLLQTEDYARTVIRADNPGVDEEEISRRIHVRMARQPLIRRATAPLHLQVALNEGILHRPVGGPKIMSGQLARLAEVSELPNVSLRVVPFSAGLTRD